MRALAPTGLRDRTTAQLALNAETLHADLRFEPDPACAAEREALGLLGQLAGRDCLFELYSQAPGAEELRACLAKHFLYGQQRARETRGQRPAAVPWLWILSAGAPRTLMRLFAPAPGWPAGVYELGGELLRVGLVVACELVVDPSTLLVRLMAGGPLVMRAVPEVQALPVDDIRRRVAEPVLLEFEHVLHNDRSRPLDAQEQEFLMTMHRTWETARDEARVQGRMEGWTEGRMEGRTEGRREMLRAQLAFKFGALPAEVEARLANAAPDELDRFAERILVSDSLAAVLA